MLKSLQLLGLHPSFLKGKITTNTFPLMVKIYSKSNLLPGDATLTDPTDLFSQQANVAGTYVHI
jgi:hypothetical protein